MDVVILLATYFETTLECRGWHGIRVRGKEKISPRNPDLYEVLRRTFQDIAPQDSQLRRLTRYEIELLVLGVENKDGANWAALPTIRDTVSQLLHKQCLAFGAAPPAYNCPKCDKVRVLIAMPFQRRYPFDSLFG